MQSKIVVLDFGSQYTQLIARRIRELEVYCEVLPYFYSGDIDSDVKGIILSGSPKSVREESPIGPNSKWLTSGLPILGICYGAQWLAQHFGGTVSPSMVREYGRANLKLQSTNSLFQGLHEESSVWMSHSDSITALSSDFESIATTETIPVAAFSHINQPIFGVQFHPEVVHTPSGKQLLENFAINICQIQPNWTPVHFIKDAIQQIQILVKDTQVVLGLSGGVDSSVAALLLHEAIGQQLHCIFVDNGLLRKNEFRDVLHSYRNMGLQVKGVDAKKQFYAALAGISDPETKRKAIGKTFIDIFEEEANQLENVCFLGQGTIYPDVIESISVHGPSVTIKSHHNVGGLPDLMKLKVVEPLRSLFKDEVRKVGGALGLDPEILNRHPFPGPGLAIRILGEITPAKIHLLQEADHIFIQSLKSHGLYDKVWQAGTILLPVQSVGVMGDERTYEQVICLRAVGSSDGMTADWIDFPHHFLAEVSNQIINQVKGINRVVYDISSKPPATIEWE